MICDNQSDYRDLEGLTKPSLAPFSENQGTDAWRVEKPSFPWYHSQSVREQATWRIETGTALRVQEDRLHGGSKNPSPGTPLRVPGDRLPIRIG